MKTAVDWCCESLAHDVMVLEERAIRAEHDLKVWREMALMTCSRLAAVLPQLEDYRLQADPSALFRQIDLDRSDNR